MGYAGCRLSLQDLLGWCVVIWSVIYCFRRESQHQHLDLTSVFLGKQRSGLTHDSSDFLTPCFGSSWVSSDHMCVSSRHLEKTGFLLGGRGAVPSAWKTRAGPLARWKGCIRLCLNCILLHLQERLRQSSPLRLCSLPGQLFPCPELMHSLHATFLFLCVFQPCWFVLCVETVVSTWFQVLPTKPASTGSSSSLTL